MAYRVIGKFTGGCEWESREVFKMKEDAEKFMNEPFTTPIDWIKIIKVDGKGEVVDI